MTSTVLSEKISRDCIKCDGPNCQEVSPSKTCSRCHTVFYCSVDCQKKHWKAEHKSYCISIKDMKQKKQEPAIPENSVSLNEDTTSDEALNAECPICFAEPIEHPVVLTECRHAFCSPCLIQWQQRSRFEEYYEREARQQKCPLCRTNTDNVMETIIQTARLYRSRAAREGCPEHDQRKYRETAIETLDKAIDDNEHTDLAIFVMKAELLISMKRGKEALECLDELERVNNARLEKARPIRELMDQADAAISRGDPNAEELMDAVVDMYEDDGPPAGNMMAEGSKFALGVQLFRADAHKVLGEWDEAIGIYVGILQKMDDPTQATPVQMREMFMGLAQCCYEAGHYDRSIKATEAALDCNRHFPGVHQYKALSEKALGKWDDAVKTMQRAAIYETPWDEENQQKVLDLYHEILEERGKA